MSPRLSDRAKRWIGWHGLGFLVGPDVVLTNYHVMKFIYRSPNQGSQSQMSVRPQGVSNLGPRQKESWWVYIPPTD